MWKLSSKRLKNIKVREKKNNKKRKLRLNQPRRELGVKEIHNKAPKPLVVNLHRLDKCLIVWVWWNLTSIIEWMKLNQTLMCVLIKWMKTLLTCNMMFTTSMSNKATHAPIHPLFFLHLLTQLLPRCFVLSLFLSLFLVYD